MSASFAPPSPRDAHGVLRRAAFVLSLATTVTLLGTSSPAQSAAELVARLSAKDAKTRAAAYRKLLKLLPPRAPSELAKRLPKAPYTAQYYGYAVLRRYRYKTIRPVLRKFARGDVPYLRLVASVDLHRHGANGYLTVIAKALRAEGVAAAPRSAMLRALGRVRDERIDASARELLHAKQNTAVLQAALDYLWAAEDPLVAQRLNGLIHEPSLRGQTALLLAAAALAWGVEDGGKALIKTLPATRVVGRATWAFLERASKLSPELLAAVATHAERCKNPASLRAATSLLVARRAKEAVATLRRIAASGNKRLAEIGLAKLAELPGELEPKDLRAMLEGTAPRLQLFAAETLRRRDDLSGLSTVLRLAKSRDKERVEAVRILGGFVISVAVQPLIDALNDNDARVRNEAYRGLARLLPRLFPFRRFDLARTGYAPNASAAERGAAVRQINAWWQKNRSAGH